jgi:hypothetical protein
LQRTGCRDLPHAHCRPKLAIETAVPTLEIAVDAANDATCGEPAYSFIVIFDPVVAETLDRDTSAR